ncbi:MAG: thiamine phosphate synthase [Rhodoferax sp.]|nr:thiamine phosphate synthase [Rhodoferax sp.]
MGTPPAPGGDGYFLGTPPAPGGDGHFAGIPPAPGDDQLLVGAPPAPGGDGHFVGAPPAPRGDGHFAGTPPAPGGDGYFVGGPPSGRWLSGAWPDLASAFPPCPQHLGLYAVLPDAAWVGRMAHAGVPTVQLRFKSDDPAAITHEVQAAVQAVQGTGALLFINDHWQAAIAAGAYGVHLGQEDLAGLGGADLDAIRTAGLRLGLSSHGYAEMLRAAKVQPSYIAMGAVYATTLKRMATPPQGPARLKLYAALLRHMPTVAIGGIDAARLPEVLASGVGSVAVVRALVAADQPEAQVLALQAMFAH